MRTVKLYGELGKRYGRVHKLHVNSVSEALRALCTNFKDFKDYLLDSDKRSIQGYEVWDGNFNLDPDEKEFNKIGQKTIKIIPRVRGSSNAAKVVIGVVLVALAIWNPMGWAALGSQGAFATQMMFSMGASMALSGIIGMMTKTSSGTTIESDSKNSQSYIFSGPVNTTRQGNPVFIGYGEMIVGSQVISATFTTKDT